MSELSDRELLEGIERVMRTSRAADAAVLAYVGEVDARKLYLPAACSSMHGFCVRVLHMSEDAAFKRIAAARAARRFPAILDAVEDGRLHLSGVVMLAPHLTDENAVERIAAASHRSKRELEVMIAAWAPRPDVPERVEPVAEPVGALIADELAPGRVDDAAPPATRAVPLAPERFALQVTIDRETRDKLERAQALLRHRLPSGDLAQVIDRALDALIDELVKEKFAGTARPRRKAERSTNDGECSTDERGDATERTRHVPADATERTRHVPAEVRRAIHERDGERCTFVSEDGVRCGERGFLELDHVDAWACGGASTADRMRVLCAAHNRFEAERRFGREHVAAKRAEASATRDLMRSLRGLGVAPADARDAIARSSHVPATTLEDRMRAALRALRTTYANRAGEPRPRWRQRPHEPASHEPLPRAKPLRSTAAAFAR